MIYIKRFLKFCLLISGIIVMIILATIGVEYLEQQTPLFNTAVLVVTIAIIAVIDVRIDQYLARRRINFNKEINETMKEAEELIKQINETQRKNK